MNKTRDQVIFPSQVLKRRRGQGTNFRREAQLRMQHKHPVPSLHSKEMGKKMETGTNFIFMDSKITANSDCTHEIKRCLILGRKTMKNLDSALKTRDITLQTEVHIVKAMVFLVVLYGCENWTMKRLSAKELMLLNCGVGEDSLRGEQGDQTSQL